MNEVTAQRLGCGTWRVAQIKSARVSATRSTSGSLRIFHTPSMAEAAHIQQMWAASDYSREAGRVQLLDNPQPRTKADDEDTLDRDRRPVAGQHRQRAGEPAAAAL